LKLLDDGVNANEVISAVVSILEDCPLTNAGIGSCLTYNGSVECDASLMSSNGHFASVGAVSGIRNPIQLVHQMIKEQSKGLMPLGRIPPMCLCGDGGYEWARLNGVPVCIPDDMITDRSKEIYIEHMERLNSEQSPKRFKPDNKIDKLDTVGAVCYDGKGMIAAGSSSGGISLKHSGRIGQAGVYGCGCWSENYQSHYIATTVSGVGEYLIKTQLAKELATSMYII
jgi:taspase (threonine aspartase 1)